MRAEGIKIGTNEKASYPNTEEAGGDTVSFQQLQMCSKIKKKSITMSRFSGNWQRILAYKIVIGKQSCVQESSTAAEAYTSCGKV